MVGEESNNAILEFLMNDKKEEVERKAKEKKQEDERRQAEREEDAKRMDKFKDELINSVRKEIKNEVQVAIEPLKERQEKTEKEAEETNEKVEMIFQEMKKMKEQMNKIVEIGANPGKGRATDIESVGESERDNLPEGWRLRNKTLESRRECSTGMEDQSAKLLRNARRVLGFKPIDRVHVEHCMRRVEQDEENLSKEEAWERAKEKAVSEFLKYEMKMKEDDIEQLKTVMIYPPAKEEWNVLYVEYEHVEMVNFVMSFAQFMRKGEKDNRPSVEKYIPMELFKRYSAIEKIAYEIRKESNFRTATNVSFGEKDFILKSRPKDIHPGGRRTPWHQLEAVKLPADIPQFELHLVRKVPQSPRSPGQAPGRPPRTPEQREKRKSRGSPSSSSPVSPTTKQQKTAIHPAGRNVTGTPALTLSNRFQCLNKSTI